MNPHREPFTDFQPSIEIPDMKNLIKSAAFLVVMMAALTACNDRTEELITYEANVPVYMPFNEFRASFEKSAPIAISHPGKMYFKDNYLFINEYGKGIHVVDNSDPSNPEKVAFFEILGNVDMAINLTWASPTTQMINEIRAAFP
jgi:hypothetical protein